MIIDVDAKTTLHALMDADGVPFTDLVQIAGLDPSADFRHADLSGVDFSGSDLTDYDFTGAVLTGASFRNAVLARTKFRNARLSSVTWPVGWNPTSGDGGWRSRSQPLTPLQQDVARALTEALRKDPKRCAVALLPVGVGKTSMLAEVFRQAMEAGTFRSGLALTESLAERAQLTRRLQDLGAPAYEVQKGQDTSEPPRAGKIRVDTVGNHRRRWERKDNPRWSDRDIFDYSHVAFTTLSPQRRIDIAAFADQSRPPAVVAFTTTPFGSDDLTGELVEGGLHEEHDAVAFVYSLQQAVRDGVLQPSQVTNRLWKVEDVLSADGRLETRIDRSPVIVADDFASELLELPREVAAIVIAADIQSVNMFTDALNHALSRQTQAGEPQRIVVPISSHHRSNADFIFGAAPSGVVLVTTFASAEGIDLRDVGLVAVTSRAPKRAGARLAYRPTGSGQLRIIDYSGTLEEQMATYGNGL